MISHGLCVDNANVLSDDDDDDDEVDDDDDDDDDDDNDDDGDNNHVPKTTRCMPDERHKTINMNKMRLHNDVVMFYFNSF